ncbi:MAG: NYN domain-containing protein [Flexilinea sp.]
MAKSSNVVYAFIDSQNLNLGTKNNITRNGDLLYQGWPLDFKKFYFYLQNKYNVSKAFLFIGKVVGNESLYNYLTNIGYQMEYKPTLQYMSDDSIPQTKGNVDSELVLHTMIEYSNFDKAIIVAGDGDYFCLVVCQI